ncbi:CBS domain-containing protein [Candidatus Parcubacteria bacterium]|nr:MAG: CBS domain-containing protein [Candidatus Parcubacteria bacterium]
MMEQDAHVQAPARDAFFDCIRAERLALTFDDVRIKQGWACVPSEGDVMLDTWFSRRVPLKSNVIVTAAMDTVTESEMAIAMAKIGGLGIVWAMEAERQADEVRRVKYLLQGRLDNPRTVMPTETLEEVLNRCRRRKKPWKFRSFPVVDAESRLIGLITKAHFDFRQNWSKRVAEVMIPAKEVMVAAADVDGDTAYEMMIREQKKFLPLLDRQTGRLVGMYTHKDLDGLRSERWRAFNLDEQGRLRVGAAIGLKEDAHKRMELLHGYVDVVVVDQMNGATSLVEETVRELKLAYPDVDIVAGNVVRGIHAQRLMDTGADGIKVGLGGGSICNTRDKSGAGTPQVSAIEDVARALRGSGVPIISDGAMVESGDVAIALAAGADCVMSGHIPAATDETPGKRWRIRGVPVKVYRGMGSKEAMRDNAGKRLGGVRGYRIPQGVSTVMISKGPVADVMKEVLAGVRLGIWIAGGRTIPEFHRCVDFDRITAAGRRESHPHNIVAVSGDDVHRLLRASDGDLSTLLRAV